MLTARACIFWVSGAGEGVTALFSARCTRANGLGYRRITCTSSYSERGGGHTCRNGKWKKDPPKDVHQREAARTREHRGE